MARSSVPWAGKYKYYEKTGRFTRESWRRWNQLSRRCINYLTRAKTAVSGMADIAENYEGLFGDPKAIRQHEDGIQVIRKRIASESAKKGPFD